ncbi:MAG: hypothetical protein HYR84_06800 [Planctomycetes bacterium]|nr:hypothetical protein [Planctomycetota bacterium]
MKRILIGSVALLIGWLGVVSVSQAQVFVRAPFVRVYVGDGVAVRAPFVNIFIPPAPRVFYPPPPVVIVEAPKPMPPVNNPNTPPAPVQPVQVPTLDGFAKSFQAKAGSYEVLILNPVTRQPTPVRFMLPEGTPRRVLVTRDSIEFIYSLRQWVRIEFDRDGVVVTSR